VGLVSEVVPADQLMDRANELADQVALCARSQPGSLGKRLGELNHGVDDALALGSKALRD